MAVQSVYPNPETNTRIQGFLDSSQASIKDYITLTKPGVLFLVVYTAFVGMLLAPSHKHPFVSFCALLSIAIASAGAAAFNMWFDRDMDAIMPRTMKRPIPAGKIAPHDALTISVLLSGTSLLIMALTGSYMGTFWLGFSIFFYTVIYTAILKRSTPQNIVIGGAAGSFPPLIAWISQTGTVELLPLVMFAIIFLWTPSHFWALALFRSNDYAKANVPMLPVTHGVHHTCVQIMVYSFLLVGASFVPVTLGHLGTIYGIAAVLLGVPYVILSILLYLKPTSRHSMMLFTYSIFYLFLLFTAMAADYLTSL